MIRMGLRNISHLRYNRIMHDTRTDETCTTKGTPMWACDYYTIEQGDESDPNPTFTDHASTMQEAMHMLKERFDAMYGATAYMMFDFDDDSAKYYVVVPTMYDKPAFEIIGTADAYELP